MKKDIFIDGETGTTGLQVHEKLSKHPNINIMSVDLKIWSRLDLMNFDQKSRFGTFWHSSRSENDIFFHKNGSAVST